MEGKKVSPKFKTQLLSDKIPNDPRIEELKKWCREFDRTGLMPSYEGGSFGNLSFRTKDDEFIITASGMKDPSIADSFVTVSNVDLNNKVIYGHGKKQPSSESMLHYAIYQKRKDVNAIFHGHSELMIKFSQKLGVPCTLKEEPYGTIELVKSVLDILGENKFIIMKAHGFISLGENMKSAGELAVKMLEKTQA
jgi:ribulose-5-phosphate 4-epimerase/fuculose-1-phosphate aldolase